jgi:hypothetical protein
MKRPLLAMGAVALAAVVFAGDPPKLGPEWTYDEKMRHYTKTMPIKVTRYGGGDGQGYHVDLQHDKVVAYDTDSNVATGVIINGRMSLDFRKDPKGGPSRISFGVVNKYLYVDLDGDGVWDGWSDSRGKYTKRFIWLDGVWAQVEDSKAGLGDTPQRSLDRKTEYTWDGKEWKSRTVDR